MVPMIDADTNAFNDYMVALKMPQATEEDKAARNKAMQGKQNVDCFLNVVSVQNLTLYLSVAFNHLRLLRLVTYPPLCNFHCRWSQSCDRGAIQVGQHSEWDLGSLRRDGQRG